MKHFKDDKAIYRDGSLGGFAPFSTIFSINTGSELRKLMGYGAGQNDAEYIIENLERDKNGNIIESIKVITHSMGSAYGKGYIQAIMDYLKKHNITGVNIIEADFAPYQPDEQKAIKGVPTQQFSHNNDHIAGNLPIEGAKQEDTSSDIKQGHSIFDFYDQILKLPAGEYRFINGKIVPNE
jgi:hypothetical protein